MGRMREGRYTSTAQPQEHPHKGGKENERGTGNLHRVPGYLYRHVYLPLSLSVSLASQVALRKVNGD